MLSLVCFFSTGAAANRSCLGVFCWWGPCWWPLSPCRRSDRLLCLTATDEGAVSQTPAQTGVLQWAGGLSTETAFALNSSSSPCTRRRASAATQHNKQQAVRVVLQTPRQRQQQQHKKEYNTQAKAGGGAQTQGAQSYAHTQTQLRQSTYPRHQAPHSGPHLLQKGPNHACHEPSAYSLR